MVFLKNSYTTHLINYFRIDKNTPVLHALVKMKKTKSTDCSPSSPEIHLPDINKSLNGSLS